MRKIFLFVLLIAVSVLQAQIVPHDLLPAKPANARPVVDDADILSTAEENALVAKLKAYNDTTSNQIVIVTVKTLHGYASDQYATEIGHYWGVGGQAKYDNGVVILLSTGTEEQGKRKVFIATGYGLEGALPSIVCKQITDNEMVPSLKAGKFYVAFDKAIDAIIKAAAGEYKAPSGYKKKGKSNDGSWIGILIIIGIVIFILIARGGRGGNGGMMSRRGFGNVAESLFWASMLSGGGGSGSSGGNDSGSGGFGDFGGGDFGGGGAGSDW